MKLIGACQPRSGTMSLLTAIERMGGRCYHMKVVLQNTLEGRGDLYKWFRIAALEPFDAERLRLLRELFAGYDACVDAPACYVYEELRHLFPDARVALTKRDASRWLASVCDTVLRPHRFAQRPLVRVCMAIIDLVWRIPVVGGIGIIGKIAALPPAVAMRPYLDEHGELLDFYDEHNHDEIRARYHHYIEGVERAVPADQLVVLEAPYEDAYRELGPIFGVEIPADEPWPHVNDRKDVNRSLDIVMALLVIVPLTFVGALLALVYALLTAPRLAVVVVAVVVATIVGVRWLLRWLLARVGQHDAAKRSPAPP